MLTGKKRWLQTGELRKWKNQNALFFPHFSMNNWRPYFWRTFVKDWSIHLILHKWWFSKLCRFSSQKPLLLWPTYSKCKVGAPGHYSCSAGFGFPAVWEQLQESLEHAGAASNVCHPELGLSTTIFYHESWSQGKHCSTELNMQLLL